MLQQPSTETVCPCSRFFSAAWRWFPNMLGFWLNLWVANGGASPESLRHILAISTSKRRKCDIQDDHLALLLYRIIPNTTPLPVERSAMAVSLMKGVLQSDERKVCYACKFEHMHVIAKLCELCLASASAF